MTQRLTATLLFVLFISCALVAPRAALAHDGCTTPSMNPCDYVHSGFERPNRPHSDTCRHLPFTRREGGYIAMYALAFDYRPPPHELEVRNRAKADAIVKAQIAQAFFWDHKITVADDDFCQALSKIEGAVSIVFCDAFGNSGYLKGAELQHILATGYPDPGVRAPLYYARVL
ncbi:MAG TPA: hypothetical protein VN495_03065 [Candidatus Paceibacterota bacterium]|nr:hypothetical protein [Candidatus Paceibacterota bacterium]